MTPRSLFAIKSTRYRTCSAGRSPSIVRIAARASVVFSFDPFSSRYAARSSFSCYGVNPRRSSPTLFNPYAWLFRSIDVSEYGSTSCVIVVPPPM